MSLACCLEKVPNLQPGPAGPGLSPPWRGGPVCSPARPLPLGSPSHDKLDQQSRQYVIVSVSPRGGADDVSGPVLGACPAPGSQGQSRVSGQEEGSSTHSRRSLLGDIPLGREAGDRDGARSRPRENRSIHLARGRRHPSRACLSPPGELPGTERLSSSGAVLQSRFIVNRSLSVITQDSPF